MGSASGSDSLLRLAEARDERGDVNGETRNAGVVVYVGDAVVGERGYGNVICGGVTLAGVCHASHGVRGAGPCVVMGAGHCGERGAGPRGVIGAGRVGGCWPCWCKRCWP